MTDRDTVEIVIRMPAFVVPDRLILVLCSRCYSEDPCDCWGQHVPGDPYDVLGGES